MTVIHDAMKVSKEVSYSPFVLLRYFRPECRQNNIDIPKTDHLVIAVPYVRHNPHLPGGTVAGKVKAVIELVIARNENHMLIMVGSPPEKEGLRQVSTKIERVAARIRMSPVAFRCWSRRKSRLS